MIRWPSPSRRRISAGLELHAWFNPYRARLLVGHLARRADHISKTHPQLVRHYGEYLWLDPGEKAVQDYSLSVIMDVVKRYDMDGVHFDDYFYPYKVKDAAGKDLDFPDDASWQRFGAGEQAEPRRLAARECQHLHRARLQINQGGEALGEVWHQPLRHLAPQQSAPDQRVWTPMRNSTPIRANGWPTAGWITSPRSFTGRLTAGAKLPRAAELVGRAKRQGPDALPGDGLDQSQRPHAVTARMAAPGDRQPDSSDPEPVRRGRPYTLGHEEPHAQRRLR